MLTLIALLFAQSSDLASVRLCVQNDQGQVQAELGFVRSDGKVWWSPPSAPDSSLRLFRSSDHLTARARSWFADRTPLRVGGKTFIYSEQHQTSWAFNRYYREHAPIDGIAVVTPLGREEETLLVLTDPIGCWFAEYRLQTP